jgi:hypothetical protein
MHGVEAAFEMLAEQASYQHAAGLRSNNATSPRLTSISILT